MLPTKVKKWQANLTRNMATPLPLTTNNNNSIVWMTSQMDLINQQGVIAHDKKEGIVTILGIGLLDRQELRDVLDSGSLDLFEDDDSSFDDSYANDSVEIAKRARNVRRRGGVGDGSISSDDSMSVTLDSLWCPSPLDAIVVVKDTLELEYSPPVVLWKSADKNSMMDIKNMPSTQTPVATEVLSKLMPIKYSNSAA
jgi:hypothetical protein